MNDSFIGAKERRGRKVERHKVTRDVEDAHEAGVEGETGSKSVPYAIFHNTPSGARKCPLLSSSTCYHRLQYTDSSSQRTVVLELFTISI